MASLGVCHYCDAMTVLRCHDCGKRVCYWDAAEVPVWVRSAGGRADRVASGLLWYRDWVCKQCLVAHKVRERLRRESQEVGQVEWRQPPPWRV